MSKYTEVRRLGSDKLRCLCIAKHWYTCGTTKEYDYLLYTLATKSNLTTEDIIEIAEDILAHSDTDLELGVASVAFEVARACYTLFFTEDEVE
jgi:hypothetical protein